ncbi:MAG TPA: efflux transporter periplasmic adaptor subunit, partial [Blastocatellia bacterium]|nr:efflux transporter periplasmic adaptor subunit [Blastocatellia bacterium]
MEKNINFLLKHKYVIGGALSVMVIALLIAVSGSKGKGKTPASSSAPPPANVEVAEVKLETVPIYSEWIGSLDGMVNAEIRAQVTGYLLRQRYTEGSFVRKGQLLFEI